MTDAVTHRDESEAELQLQPPSSFGPELLSLWNELLSIAPTEVITQQNYPILEAACRLMQKFREETATRREFRLLLSCLMRLRMTPASRCRHRRYRPLNSVAQINKEVNA